MGQTEHKQPQAPPPTIDDAILDMRMTSKRFANEARRCEREKEQLMVKARQAMQKNNDEGARMFLTSAMNKAKEGENLQRMSHKMDYLQGMIKNTTNQTKTMESLSKITPMLSQQVQQMPMEQLYANLNQFESAMDEITVQGKVMDGLMNKNVDVGQDLAVDQMMGQLKQEIHNQTTNELGANHQAMFNELGQPQVNANQAQVNNQQQYK